MVTPKRTRKQSERHAFLHGEGVDFDSSAIKAIEYDRRDETLTVYMHHGEGMRYVNVTVDVWDNLVSSESKGRFYNSEIRDRYQWEYTI